MLILPAEPMPHRIFVVEDDAGSPGLLVRRLREAGFVADGAADGGARDREEACAVTDKGREG